MWPGSANLILGPHFPVLSAAHPSNAQWLMLLLLSPLLKFKFLSPSFLLYFKKCFNNCTCFLLIGYYVLHPIVVYHSLILSSEPPFLLPTPSIFFLNFINASITSTGKTSHALKAWFRFFHLSAHVCKAHRVTFRLAMLNMLSVMVTSCKFPYDNTWQNSEHVVTQWDAYIFANPSSNFRQ